jgi:adenine-specific DNA-methyltransferase
MNLKVSDAVEFLKGIPDQSIKLIVTSPPYNIGKEYEKKTTLENYLKYQNEVISECHRVLTLDGSICWQIGNYVDRGEIFPLDIYLYPIFKELGFRLRNRVIWHFGHGLHCKNRLSGRYETILWFTKNSSYTFNLDTIRIPQKYKTKKHYKGARKGELSCHPLGKNPGDVWEISNVKHNHPEKTEHPCQFPLALVDRLILSMSNEGDIVLDPFAGSGTTLVSTMLANRIGYGCDIKAEYIKIAKDRINKIKE